MSSLLLLALALQQSGPAAASAPVIPRAEETLQPSIEWVELPRYIDMPHQLRDSVRFGYLRVPQDHAEPTGTTLRMAFALVVASSPNPAPDPLVFIVGGPGWAGIQPHFRNRLRGPHPLDVHRARRNLIVFDQRGNGLSDPRMCPEVSGLASPQLATDPNSPVERAWRDTLARCRRRLLAEGVRLETLSSVQVAHDLEWLRRALGASQLNLIGSSYGSRVAAEAVRHFPATIRAVHFSAPVPPEASMGVRDEEAEEVLRTLLRRCAERPECRTEYPRLNAEYDSVLTRLRHTPIRVRLPPSDLGHGGELLVDDGLMRRGLADLLVNRDLAAGVPLLIHTLFEQGTSLLVRMVPQLAQLVASDQDPETALAFWCNDGRVNQGSDALLRQRCRAWLGEEWNHEGAEPLRSDVPALVETGELDPRTPPSYAHGLAAGLPRAHLVIIPWYGHEEPSGCAMRISRDFITAPERAPDTACLDSIPPIEFVTGVVYSRWIGATVSRMWERPWLAGLPSLAALLLLLAVVGIPLRDLRGRGHLRAHVGRATSLVLFVVALVGLIFILTVAVGVISGARRHLFITAIGLPAQWAWVFALPWVLLALACGAAVITVRPRSARPPIGVAGWCAVTGTALLLTTWLVNLIA